MLGCGLIFTSCSNDEKTITPVAKTESSSIQSRDDRQVEADAIQYITEKYVGEFTTEETLAARACIQSTQLYSIGVSSGILYTVCVTIGKKTYTVTLNYPTGENGYYFGSAVEGSCSC